MGGGDLDNLKDALMLDRGSTVLTAEERGEALRRILEWERDHVDDLARHNSKAMLLRGAAGGAEESESEERKLIYKEVADLLGMEKGQKDKVASAVGPGALDASRALAGLNLTLTALLSTPCLQSPGCDVVAARFLKILNKQQVQKFLVWADGNAEGIDGVDYVRAGGRGGTFYFGDEQPEEKA